MTDNIFADMAGMIAADDEDRDRLRSGDSLVRFWTGGDRLALWAPCGNHQDLKLSDSDLSHGTLSCTLPGNEVWDEYFSGLPEFLARLVSVDPPEGDRLSYIITDVDRVPVGDGHVWELNAVATTRYLDFSLWPDPLLPPEIQISGSWRGVGPAVTVLKTAWALNLARLQSELWSIPVTNPFDPGTWNLIAKASNPVIVNPRGTGLHDTSGWILTEWRMDNCWTETVEICKAMSLSPRATLWLPGDPQPFPEWLRLTEPRIVVDVVPSPRELRFTGTLADGAIREAIKIADDAFDWIMYPILGPDGGIEDSLERARGPLPIPVYRAGEWSPIADATTTTSYPSATRATVGGRSPDWLNSLIADGVGSGVAALGTAIGMPGLRLGFLEKLAQNRLLAFHSVENRALAAEAGRWRLRESFAGSQTTALSLQAAEAAKSTLWATRGRVSRKAVVNNGAPYFYGRHLRVGGIVAVEHDDGTATVDTLSAVEIVGDQVTLTLSTPEPSEPGLYALTKIREASGWLNRLAMET